MQMYKWKAVHTIDFYIDDNRNMYGTSENGSLVLFDNFAPFEEDGALKSGVYECVLHSTSMNKLFFKLVKERLDKKRGNSVDVINSTVKSITVNHLSKESLFSLCAI